jgi:hypothetical protein
VLQLANLAVLRVGVIGIDIAPLLLDAARERADGLGHVSFIEGDAVVLDLSGESIDAFFSRFGVMVFPEPAAAFSNFRRMLKPTGRLARYRRKTKEKTMLCVLGSRTFSHGLGREVTRRPQTVSDSQNQPEVSRLDGIASYGIPFDHWSLDLNLRGVIIEQRGGTIQRAHQHAAEVAAGMRREVAGSQQTVSDGPERLEVMRFERIANYDIVFDHCHIIHPGKLSKSGRISIRC